MKKLRRSVKSLMLAISSLGLSFGAARFSPSVDSVRADDVPTIYNYQWRFMDVHAENPSNFDGQETVLSFDDRHGFQFGYTYFLWGLSASYDPLSNEWVSYKFYWNRYNDSYSQHYFNDGLLSAFGFSSLSPSPSVFYCYERTNMGLIPYAFDSAYSTNLSMGTPSFNLLSSVRPSNLETIFSVTNSGPYYLYLDNDKTFEYLLPYVQSIYSEEGYQYTNGYNDGYIAGYGDMDGGGYHDGYDAGITDGSRTTPGNVFTDLGTAIVNIPIKILAGLSVFTIFDTPIVAIVVTFLLIAVGLFVIKRFF